MLTNVGPSSVNVFPLGPLGKYVLIKNHCFKLGLVLLARHHRVFFLSGSKGKFTKFD